MSACGMMGGAYLNPLFWIGVAGCHAWYAITSVCEKVANTTRNVASGASSLIRNNFFNNNAPTDSESSELKNSVSPPPAPTL